MTRLLIALGLSFFLAVAVSATPHPPLVVILLPGTSLNDWRAADAPTLHGLMTTGAVAVMNTRTARLPNDHRRESPGSALLTLGAGSRAAGGSEISDFFPSRARQSLSGAISCGELYARRMGTEPPMGAEVNIEWPRILRENTHLGYDLLLGNLGDGLNKHGVAIAAGGGPMARPLACNSAGTTAPVVRGASFPHPLPPLLIWDAGSDIADADAVIQAAVSEVQQRGGQLIVVSPFVDDRRYSRGERLAPILVWGQGIMPGLLYSALTHREGLITNTDFAPSVTAYFNARGAPWWLPVIPFGHPWAAVPKTAALESLIKLESDSYRQTNGMKTLPALAVCLGILLIADAVCTWRGLSVRWLQWLPGVVVCALIASPSAAIAALWAGVLSIIFWRWQARHGARGLVLFTALFVVLTLVTDMLSGNRLMQHSLLGYSAVEGARYYGIGNEAMGPLVGSALFLAAFFWASERRRRIFIVLLLFGVSLLLGLPSVGAKAGGLLVAVAAFSFFAWTASGRHGHVRAVAAIIAVMLLLLALVSLADWHHATGSQSHIGGAVARISAGGTGEVWDIMRRKLTVEGHLLIRSTWAIPMWASVLGLVGFWKRNRSGADTRVRALFSGGTAGVVVCLAVNDAGVVAAALCGTLVLSGIQTLRATEKPMSAATDVA